MANKTLIPALKAKVGDWNYYICVMKYAQVAKEFSFAYELNSNPDLGDLLQRGLGERTQEIVEYLKKSEHRFLGSLIVAAYGGDPHYVPVQMDEHDELVRGLDSGFGVLTFDGSQQYFALDGQHRLKAIKDAIKQKPELGKDEISVIMVSHYDTSEGQERTRRLFTNINKNAKSTSSTENIALDEDDGFAILNRRLINENSFFKIKDRVSIYKKQISDGSLSIATSVSDSNKTAVTSIKQLYELVKFLSFDTALENHNIKIRPSDEDLESSFKIINKRIDELFDACGDIRTIAMNGDLRPLRKNKAGAEYEHPFLKGIIQKTIPKVISELIKCDLITWELALERLRKLPWQLDSAPWTSVVLFTEDRRKMLTNREYVGLLESSLKMHLAPKSKNDIKKTRKAYLDLKGMQYPIDERVLQDRIIENG
ncbi:DGQHR domain-containing protein [Pseudoalteromonas sp. SR45-1]|uniref:DNA sulfur modification protein DndB n=1 Tax=Pseudoalteromonas sp. SR45-1 TaxID=2760932 RepID=UPI0015FF93E5|nr:DNA sulfur modification protein DndB [Pseudoalteromonas sp. SR45-1]MBB1325439.1 DGQHR domain-containing protein [Pseudoalteromonas sp. SR45-1]